MSDKSKKLGSANDKPRIFSLKDIKNDNHDDSSDDEKQTYYAGGEKSGTAVQGGGKKDGKSFGEAQEIMKKIFEKASTEDPTLKNTNLFGGSGKKLNTTNNPKSSSQKLPENDIATVNLVFWNDGFTIGNGPLRPYDDREGLRLLENLRNGTIAAEDLGINPNQLADVKISQISNERFTPERLKSIINAVDLSKQPQNEKPSFTGTGEKIGLDNSEIISVDASSQLDPSCASTRIQIVLPNGSRKVIKISPRSKVSDLYLNVRNETNLRDFVLKVGNPAKLIPEDLDALIFQIGLLNASIILTQI